MVAGFLAGALFGLLVREIGVWSIVGLKYLAMLFVLLFGVLGAAAGVSPLGRRLLWTADALLLLIVSLVAFTPVMTPLMRPLVRADPVPTAGVDAIVALSADVTPRGAISDVGADRLLTALELARRGVAPRLFTTRIAYRRFGTFLSSDADQRRLISLAGVSDRWTPLVERVGNTHDEALVVANHLRGFGGKSVAVVTSPWHTRRACATFESVGLRVVCVPALERGNETRVPESEADRLAALQYFLYEEVGSLVYRWRGWLKRPS